MLINKRKVNCMIVAEVVEVLMVVVVVVKLEIDTGFNKLYR